ncbi:MAG: DUF2190 family protein [Phycisphaeraceae bacterium]|nr:DUF2190 family protein [Phycisphaeraceae bacterium]
MATFVHDGSVIDYTPGSDVVSGAVVVQGELVGVSPRPIAANTPGVLAVAGVFDFPKATGASTAITAGANCYWDAGNHQATTTATGNKLIGKSVRAAADADATVRIRLMQ